MSFVSLTNYILVGKKVVREMDLIAWAIFFEGGSKRRVKLTVIDEGEINEIHISTVFLGVDHNMLAWETEKEDYQPIIFETLLTSSDHKWNDIQQRYKTWDEAVLGHANKIKEIMRDRVKIKSHRTIYL